MTPKARRSGDHGDPSPLIGQTIQTVQVLSPNALTQVLDLHILEGLVVTDAVCMNGFAVLSTTTSTLRIDLQRTGKAAWVEDSNPWQAGSGPRPTIRFVTSEGSLDFVEPARTKRIRLTLEATEH